ncbi:MAG: AAA family ATPase [Bacteroidota bacterium]
MSEMGEGDSIVSVSSAIRVRAEALIEGLSQALYEREEPIKLAFLAAVAGESIFLLGPPGVAKSLIARKLKHAFRDAQAFEYLMSKFSTPDEIFGPVSIKKLKEEDTYERKTERYLPGAQIVFLDEIWKAGPAIQNALLTILNEKIYRNGEEDIEVDLNALIMASNELPPDREGLQPLWDRLLVRYPMEGVRENRNFLRMITDTQDVYADQVPEAVKVSPRELADWSEQIDAIELPEEVLNVIQVVREKIQRQNEKAKGPGTILVYDRRWKKIVRLLRAAAFLNGRHKVDLMDTFLMVFCLWSKPAHIPSLKKIIGETVRNHGYSLAVNLSLLRKELEAFEQEVKEETHIRQIQTQTHLLPVQEAYYGFVAKDKPFQGDLLKIKEFNELSLDEYQVINIYDDSLTLRHRLKAKRSSKEFAVDILYNSQSITFDLHTAESEQVKHIYKKPHKLVEAHWNERFEQLNTFLREQIEKLDRSYAHHTENLKDNLFVSPELLPIVLANMEEVRQALDSLQLKLEKIQHAYVSL